MWPSLIGCNVPFTILLFATIGSIVCSFVIGTDDSVLNKKLYVPQLSPLISSSVLKTNGNIKSDKLLLNLFPTSHNLIASKLKHQPLKPASKNPHAPENNPNNPSFLEKYSEFPGTPPITLASLRKKYGVRKKFWGDWSNKQTRDFYQTHLPRALQIEGAYNLSLEERAQLASESRHALRIYSRERCNLPGRIISQLYDGFRHLFEFGSWNPEGMSWTEVKAKYLKQARKFLPSAASLADLNTFVYAKILDKACSTNYLFDTIAKHGAYNLSVNALNNIIYNHSSVLNNMQQTVHSSIHHNMNSFNNTINNLNSNINNMYCAVYNTLLNSENNENSESKVGDNNIKLSDMQNDNSIAISVPDCKHNGNSGNNNPNTEVTKIATGSATNRATAAGDDHSHLTSDFSAPQNIKVNKMSNKNIDGDAELNKHIGMQRQLFTKLQNKIDLLPYLQSLKATFPSIYSPANNEIEVNFVYGASHGWDNYFDCGGYTTTLSKVKNMHSPCVRLRVSWRATRKMFTFMTRRFSLAV